MVRDPSRRRLALSDRLIEVIDERQTGETILDEALKMIKSSEKYGVGAWIDLMSGEFWVVAAPAERAAPASLSITLPLCLLCREHPSWWYSC